MSVPTADTSGAWRARAHRTAKNYDWDSGCDKLHEIIRRQCDLGTALLIYWRGRPDFYRRYKRRCDLTVGQNEFDMLVEIERNVIEGFYIHRNIPFNPFDDEGQIWCCKPKRDVYFELPEAMYRGVGSPEQMSQREPLRSGILDLPIGLSALVAADPQPQNNLDRAIVFLNSRNDNTVGNVVQKSNGTVTGISFFLNRKATDADLRYLEFFPNLTILELGPEMTDHALANLRFVPNLRILGLLGLGPKMTDQALDNLRFVPKLRTLKLMNNPISDEGLAHLHHVSDLEELWLHGCKCITNAGLIHVEKLKKL